MYRSSDVVTGRGFAAPPKLSIQAHNTKQVNTLTQYNYSPPQIRQYDNYDTPYDSENSQYDQLQKAVIAYMKKYNFDKNRSRKTYNPPQIVSNMGRYKKESNTYSEGIPRGR